MPEVITMRDIGKNIRQLRVRQNMTQDELAQKLFVTRQTVSNYETGKSKPDVEMLERIAEVLHTDILTVIYGPQPKKIPGIVFACGAAVLMGFLLLIANVQAKKWIASQSYEIGKLTSALFILWPMYFAYLGWLAGSLVGTAMKWKPKNRKGLRWAGWVLAGLLVFWFLMMVLHFSGQHIGWISRAVYGVYVFAYRIHVPHHLIYLLPGVALWLLGFPKR